MSSTFLFFYETDCFFSHPPQETLENAHVTYQQKKTDEISVDGHNATNELQIKMAKASIDEKKSP